MADDLDNVRADMRRMEERIERRLDRQDADSLQWRTRFEASNDNRHVDNLKRLEELEKAFNQGVGALGTIKAAWLFLVGVGGLVAGWLGHKLGN